MDRRAAWTCAAAWGLVALAYLAGWLTPDLRFGVDPPWWLYAVVPLVLALLLATLAAEKDRAPDAARRARLGLALGASHVVAFSVLVKLAWDALDFVRGIHREAAGRVVFLALGVLLAAALLPSGTGRVPAWTILGRSAVAGAALAVGVIVALDLLAGRNLGGLVGFLFSPFVVVAIVPGAIVGLAFGALDLALVRILRA